MDIPVNAAKPGRRRYLTLVMIFITVVICYVDRANLAVASAHIQEEFGITKAQMGYVFSAFAWLSVSPVPLSPTHSGRAPASRMAGPAS